MPSHGNDEEFRRIIVQEVAKQLEPFAKVLSDVRDWQLGFWSNGSGRPPGFFQGRMKDDDRRNREIDERFAELFRMKREELEEIKPIKQYIADQIATESQRDKDKKDLALALKKQFDKRVALMTLFLGVLMLLIGLWDHKDAIKKSFVTAPDNPAVQSPQQPETSHLPVMRGQ